MKKILYLLFLLPVLVFSQSQDQNYVKTKTYKVATTTSSTSNVIESITYYDGLGRPVQSIATKAGGGSGWIRPDIVTHMEYDALGRQSRNYLPYAESAQTVSDLDFRDPITLKDDIIDYYTAKYPGELQNGSENPFSQTFYEASPLGRVLEQAAPGKDWKGNPLSDTDHTVKFAYDTNDAMEVRKFNVIFTDTDDEVTELECTGYYLPETLLKTITKDENWVTADGNNKTTEEFKDLEGRVVLKRTYNNDEPHDTHYVYDIYGNLTYVIPPLATDDIIETVVSFNSGGKNFPWTSLVNVSSQVVNNYAQAIAGIPNADILNVDLYSQYGGKGGFSIIPDAQGNLVLNINVTTSSDMPYRTGIIADLTSLGTFTDRDLGRIKTGGYDYFFLIRGNKLEVTGGGNVPSLNDSFNSNNPPQYLTNYPWSDFCKGDAQVLANYETAIASLDNSDILTTYTANPYSAMGGVSISVDQFDTVSLSLNITATTDMELRTGSVFPLGIQRALPNMTLGTVSGSGYSYEFKIMSNNLYISGSGKFRSISLNSIKYRVETYTTRPEVEGLLYIYHYDKRNRVIEKHIPDAGWTHMVYDKLDRLILTQDENLRNETVNPNWLFTKYDKFGRVVYTGLYKDLRTRKVIQVERDGIVNPTLSETRGSAIVKDGANVYYTNQAWPTTLSNMQLHTVNYYDSYGFSPHTPPSSVYSQALTANLRGLATGSLVRALDGQLWQTTIVGYDALGRVIYNYTDNDYIDYTHTTHLKLQFTGVAEETTNAHVKAGTTTTVIDYFAYDHMLRLLNHSQKVNSQAIKLIAYNQYDELGIAYKKKVGGSFTPGPDLYGTQYQNTAALQEVDYSYNIRGWLRGINNTGQTLTDDLFAFKINYNTEDISSSTQLYNGNIAETHWKTKADNVLRSYSYTFDDMNRMMQANFKSSGADNRYNEGDLAYDKGGNILQLGRRGRKTDTTWGYIDQLVYSYMPYSNRLLKVTDTSNDVEGFTNGTSGTSSDYAYDDNGNLTKDLNKGIGSTGIAYNHLNLPVLIKKDATHFIEYKYDALGTKLKKVVTDGGNITTTLYAGGAIYENNVMQYYTQPEGYVRRETNGTFNYVYQYKDHLGNVRVSYCDVNNNGSIASTEVMEETNYYPFGLTHKGYNVNVYSTNIGQKNKYNLKEIQGELLMNFYDYGARNMMPDLGRFFNIDRLAEKYEYLSPYNYTANNPVYFIDVNGEWIYIWGGEQNASQKFRYEAGVTQALVDGNWIDINQTFITIPDFVISVISALQQLEASGSTGNGLVDHFSGEGNNITFAYGQRPAKQGTTVVIDPNQAVTAWVRSTEGYTLMNTPLFVIIGHEMAHVKYDPKIDINPGQWYSKNVRKEEIMATHIENKIRAEAGIPLRTHYGSKFFNGVEYPNPQSTLIDCNGNSVYFNSNEQLFIHKGNGYDNAPLPTQQQMPASINAGMGADSGIILNSRYNYLKGAKKP